MKFNIDVLKFKLLLYSFLFVILFRLSSLIIIIIFQDVDNKFISVSSK